MRHITLWAILLIALLIVPASTAVTLSSIDIPYSDTPEYSRDVTYSYNSYIPSYVSGDTYAGDALSIYFSAVQYYPNLNYVHTKYETSQTPCTGETPPDGIAIMYLRPLDSTLQPARMYVSYNRNILGSLTGVDVYVFFSNWKVGSKTGVYNANLYYPNGSKVHSMPTTVSAYPILKDTNPKYAVLSYQGNGGRRSPGFFVPPSPHYETSAVGYELISNTLNIDDLSPDFYKLVLNRFVGGSIQNSYITINTTSGNVYTNSASQNFTAMLSKNTNYYIKLITATGNDMAEYSLLFSGGSDHSTSSDFTLTLSPTAAAVGDPITATLTNIPTDSNRLILNVNGVIHQDITNPYNFSAIGNSGETIYVFANCYDSSNNLLYSSNVVSYTLTGELEPIEPYPELEEVEITGVAPSYTQGNTLTATLNDNSIAGINEIWWKIIPQTDENGNPSTITGKRYEYKEFSTDNWQLKSGSSYTGSYTYADVKSLSHYIDGYGLFDVEVNCYNSTNGLIAIDKVNSYANPASYIKPVNVYIYGNSGLYSGEITLTTEYIVQSKNTTYYIYNGYDTINVVKAGDYNIYIDLTDNSIYKDKVLQYSYDSDGSILRIYLEEDYNVSEHAKLSVRVVDTSNNPLSFANVHFIGLAESSMSTNANGYAEYIGINNETVKFTASKTGYISGEGSITLSDSINSFTLVLSTLTETITPTETSTSPDEDEGYNPFTNFIAAIMEFGFNEESAKIVVALGLVGLLFACGVKFGESTGAGLAGAVIGVIFSALLSLIPMWVIMAIILCAAAILATKFYADR